MIKIKIGRNQEGKVVTFSGSGHAFYDKAGKDVVCAAISTLFHHVILSLGRYLNISLEVKKNKKKGILSVEIGQLKPDLREKADIILETLLISLLEIKKQYPENIKIEDT